MQSIRTIIFDLGGVFLNIDYQRTENAFIDLGITDFGARFNQQFSNPLFENLETGKISAEVFYDQFRLETQTNLSNEAIANAWNAMLLDFPAERLVWLEQISKKYAIYLFSNTNIIHYESFMEIFANQFPGKDFNSFFIKAHYSHELGERKPDVTSYQRLIDIHHLNGAETLFIDDTLKNITGAQAAGLQTIHLKKEMTVLDLGL